MWTPDQVNSVITHVGAVVATIGLIVGQIIGLVKMIHTMRSAMTLAATTSPTSLTTAVLTTSIDNTNTLQKEAVTQAQQMQHNLSGIGIRAAATDNNLAG